MEIMLEAVKFLLGQGVGPFFSMAGEEYLVPPLHGPKDFYEFNVRYDKPIIDLVHEAGGRVHIHCHGSVKKVMQGFLDMGVDVLHPFEAPPMGDITPAEAKATIRGRMCYEGNIQIHHMYECSPEEVREETEVLIDTVFDDSAGLIVCPTASPYIPGKGEACLGRFRAMVEAVHGWARRG
jgi:uroporphyrinogen-III decarboxylase